MTATAPTNPNPYGRDLPNWGAIGNGAHRHALIPLTHGRVATMCGKQAAQDRVRVQNIAGLPLCPGCVTHAAKTVSAAVEEAWPSTANAQADDDDNE